MYLLIQELLYFQETDFTSASFFDKRLLSLLRSSYWQLFQTCLFFFFSWPTGGLDRKTRTRRKTSIFQHHKPKVASYRNNKHNRNKSETYFFKMQKQCLENGFFIPKTFVTGN